MRKFSFPREKSSKTNPGATVHTCNLSPWEVEFKVSLGCIELDPDLIDTLSQKQTKTHTTQIKPNQAIRQEQKVSNTSCPGSRTQPIEPQSMLQKVQT